MGEEAAHSLLLLRVSLLTPQLDTPAAIAEEEDTEAQGRVAPVVLVPAHPAAPSQLAGGRFSDSGCSRLFFVTLVHPGQCLCSNGTSVWHVVQGQL